MYFLQLVTIPVNLVYLIVLLFQNNSITIAFLVCNIIYFWSKIDPIFYPKTLIVLFTIRYTLPSFFSLSLILPYFLIFTSNIVLIDVLEYFLFFGGQFKT